MTANTNQKGRRGPSRSPKKATLKAAAPPSNFRTAKTVPISVASIARPLPMRSRKAHKAILPAKKTKKTLSASQARFGIGGRSPLSVVTGTSGCCGTQNAEIPSTATTPASASAAPGYWYWAMTNGGRANSTAAVTDNSTPWRVPKACTLLGRSERMRMPRQVMVEEKKPISAHMT